jgi:hypothetical protein
MFDLNCIQARSKWYVYHRPTKAKLVTGFVGSRVELEQHLATIRPLIVAQLAAAQTAVRAKVDGWRMDAANALHKMTYKRAARRGLAYELSAALIAEMLMVSNDKCAISGMDFDYRDKKKLGADWHRRPLTPSIDRKNNALGYTVSNTRIVCACVNISINEWGADLFIHMCESVVQNVLQNGSFQPASMGPASRLVQNNLEGTQA